ncbi:DUF6303 family protein [Streptomyces sp. NPDC056045]|uniref:DUF6303 family protein n=1 Tax=Streptomyces sp. NPDC056045 TaxID=3345691 RepID=UPI0035D62501
MRTHARMATGVEGTWVLYVLSDAPWQEWPEFTFRRVVPIPTPEERTAALTSLGYVAVDGAGWEWREICTGVAAHLFAAIPVRPAGPGEGGAA